MDGYIASNLVGKFYGCREGANRRVSSNNPNGHPRFKSHQILRIPRKQILDLLFVEILLLQPLRILVGNLTAARHKKHIENTYITHRHYRIPVQLIIGRPAAARIHRSSNAAGKGSRIGINSIFCPMIKVMDVVVDQTGCHDAPCGVNHLIFSPGHTGNDFSILHGHIPILPIAAERIVHPAALDYKCIHRLCHSLPFYFCRIISRPQPQPKADPPAHRPDPRAPYHRLLQLSPASLPE